jgi:hypothetical protein
MFLETNLKLELHKNRWFFHDLQDISPQTRKMLRAVAEP